MATAIGQATPAPRMSTASLGVLKLMMCGKKTAVLITASMPMRPSSAISRAV